MRIDASNARRFRVARTATNGANGAWLVVPVDFRARGKDAPTARMSGCR